MTNNKSPREVLEKYRSAPISTLTTEGRVYSIDEAVKDLADIVLALQKDITQSYDDFDNGYETGWRTAITDIAKLFTDKEGTK